MKRSVESYREAGRKGYESNLRHHGKRFFIEGGRNSPTHFKPGHKQNSHELKEKENG